MAAPAAILAVKAAIAVATDKRGRTVIASVVAAVLLPFILVIVMLLSIMDGASSHNVSAVAQVFWEGAISSQVPEEYRKYIVDMQTSFASLEDLIADIDHVEDRELDIEWVKSVFYAMYFGSAQPSLLAQKEFVDCFVETFRSRNWGGSGGKCSENLYGSCLWPGCSGRDGSRLRHGGRKLSGPAYGGNKIHWFSLPVGRFQSTDVL